MAPRFTPAERAKRYTLRHPERAAASQDRWRKANAPQVRLYGRQHRAKYRKALMDLFGNKCLKCGFNDSRALQLDHINRADEPQGHPFRGGWRLYREILQWRRDKAEFQLLCANCNAIKIWENKEFAHFIDEPVVKRIEDQNQYRLV